MNQTPNEEFWSSFDGSKQMQKIELADLAG